MKNIKRIKKIINLLAVLFIVFSHYTSFANCSDAFNGHFVVRQETVRDGSILVCRPSSIDLRIVNLITSNNIKSLDEYSAWLETNIQYTPDKGTDDWAMPGKTLDRLYGDCEDYALLNSVVLAVLGYKAKIFILGTSIGDHAICVFEKNGKFLWFDNAEIKYTDASTLSQFRQYMAKKYACTHVTELKPDDKRCGVLYIEKV